MKCLLITSIFIFLFACSSSPPLPPQPVGEKKEVNPKEIDIKKLIQKNE